MALKLKNIQQLRNHISEQANDIESTLLYNLEYLVAELQNHAKKSAEYNDQTGNLKSSIGGVVLKDNKPISYTGFQVVKKGKEGTVIGSDFLTEQIKNASKGYVLLLVAGMEYATYVENFHNLNVLKKTELYAAIEMPKIVANLKLE